MLKILNSNIENKCWEISKAVSRDIIRTIIIKHMCGKNEMRDDIHTVNIMDRVPSHS